MKEVIGVIKGGHEEAWAFNFMGIGTLGALPCLLHGVREKMPLVSTGSKPEGLFHFSKPSVDPKEILSDSTYVEWAFMLNMDKQCIEVYRGWNNQRNAPGRYAALAADAHCTYQGVRLVTELTYEQIRNMRNVDGFCQNLLNQVNAEDAKSLSTEKPPTVAKEGKRMSKDNTAQRTKKLYVMDASWFIRKAYHAVPPLSGPDGTPTNAISGYVSALQKLLKTENPPYLAIAHDVSREGFRREIYPEYKANRSATPDDLRPQLPIIRDIIEAYGIKQFAIEGFEADDIVATLSTRFEAEGFEIVMVANDKDLKQLLTDKVVMFEPSSGRMTTVETLKEKLGVTPDQFIDVQALQGDTSDNIPGVPGIGEKTAAQLVAEFGDLEGILSNIDQISGKKRKENLTIYADQARMSRKLVTLRRDVPLEISADDLIPAGPNIEKLTSLFTRLGMEKAIKEMNAQQIPDDPAPTVCEQTVEIFSDGACSGNPGPGGYGTLLRFRGTEKTLSGHALETTNNRMELMGAIVGLETLTKPCKVVLTTDSTYVKKGITEWIHGWLRRGWKNGEGKAVANQDLWQRLLKASEPHQVDWRWVRGHNGHRENEICDQLAVEAVETARAELANPKPEEPVDDGQGSLF